MTDRSSLVTTFFSEHLIVTALLASGLWFYCGYADVKKGRTATGISWQLIGVLLLIAFSVHAVLSKSWYALATALLGIITEVQLIRRREYHKEKSASLN
jgi:hypothetical protein